MIEDNLLSLLSLHAITQARDDLAKTAQQPVLFLAGQNWTGAGFTSLKDSNFFACLIIYELK